MFSSPFTGRPKVEIPDDAEVIFVSDMFSDDHAGGAELTTDSLIDKSSYNVFRLHSRDITLDILSQGQSRYWIFGNFFSINPELIPSIIANLRYSVVEYDYKYCKYRSPEKHEEAETTPCDCHDQMNGKMVSAFYYAAQSLWWMSQDQMQRYHSLFPFLADVKNTVLSSVFSDESIEYMRNLREKIDADNRKGWIVLGSTSWIKGADDSEKFCKDNDLDYETVWDIPYNDFLSKLSESEGLVFLPKGGDTCPRLVIEAKLLGCSIITNEHVQHAKEGWFDTEDIEKVESYLLAAGERFWKSIRLTIETDPTISGYTTTLDCIKQNYPFIESISSLLSFCDQVVVVDGGSTDGTWERLQELSESNSQLLIHQQARDWDHPRFAVFDGLQKALARALCTGDFCWQQDSDEIVHERDYEKIAQLTKQLPKNIDLVALPVIEYWGGTNKVRVDVNPWKWRLSRNKPHITHGIPRENRKFDEDGHLYAAPGTDGCDYIRSDTFDRVQFANFYTPESHELRVKTLDTLETQQYESWFREILNSLPAVHHYSWFDLKRKIRTYRDYWSHHWQSLYGIMQEDTPENNMFFDKRWKDVTEDEISSLADRLSSEMGGWIFHSRVDFNKKTPSVDVGFDHPSVMDKWIKK